MKLKVTVMNLAPQTKALVMMMVNVMIVCGQFTMSRLQKKKAASQNSDQSEEQIPTKLKHYLSQPTIPLGDDILKYWDINGNMFPLLKKIVQPYLSVVATSVPSERLFSKAGNIMTEKRNRLKGEKLQQLLFLNSLNFEDWQIE